MNSVRPQIDSSTLESRVKSALEELRPLIQWDGGDLELVEITDAHVAVIRLLGACVGCPSSQATLKLGIEKSLRDKVPEITGVEASDG
jgi:Fe-S cluster biogenesis protein NfuA